MTRIVVILLAAILLLALMFGYSLYDINGRMKEFDRYRQKQRKAMKLQAKQMRIQAAIINDTYVIRRRLIEKFSKK